MAESGLAGVTGGTKAPKAGSSNKRPRSIAFFRDGSVTVLDGDGAPMPRYQELAAKGGHAAVIAAMERDGVDYQTLPEKRGEPILPRVGKASTQVWDGKPPRDEAGKFTGTLDHAVVTVPMLRLTGPAGQRPYVSHGSRLDVRFSADEWDALRQVFDALQATGVILKSSASQGEALKWMLRQLVMERAAAKVGKS